MHRIDARTVEFTTVGETTAKERFETLLDDGLSICLAAATALEEGAAAHWRFGSDFVNYLSDGTVIVVRDERVVLTPLGSEAEGFTREGQAAVNRLVREGRTFRDAVAHVRGGPAMLRD